MYLTKIQWGPLQVSANKSSSDPWQAHDLATAAPGILCNQNLHLSLWSLHLPYSYSLYEALTSLSGTCHSSVTYWFSNTLPPWEPGQLTSHIPALCRMGWQSHRIGVSKIPPWYVTQRHSRGRTHSSFTYLKSPRFHRHPLKAVTDADLNKWMEWGVSPVRNSGVCLRGSPQLFCHALWSCRASLMPSC